MNLFTKIMNRKDNSIQLDRKKLLILGDVFTKYMDKLDNDRDLYTQSLSYISKKESEILGYDKNIPPQLTDDIFSGLLKLFFSLNVLTDEVGKNISIIIKDFNFFLQFYEGVKKEVSKRRKYIIAGVLIQLVVLLGLDYAILFQVDLPAMLSNPTFKATPETFSLLFTIWGSKFIIGGVFFYLCYIILKKMNSAYREKKLKISKSLDAYLFNIAIYHSIMNSYKSKDKVLQYYNYLGILNKITTYLKKDNFISENDFMLYQIYINNPLDADGIVENESIAKILNNYYNVSKSGERNGYDEVISDIKGIYSLNNSNLQYLILSQFEDFKGFTGTLMQAATQSGMIVLMIFLFMIVGIIMNGMG